MSPPWAIPQDANWREVNGYPMTYQDVGSGPAIVLVHGSITDYRVWEPIVPGLSSRFRVIAPSLRHYYPEPWDGLGTDFTIEQQAADVVALVRSLGVDSVHLLGWSRGGLVAVEMARQAPELVKTLILEDGSIVLAEEETGAMRQARVAAEARRGALKAAIQSGEYERGAQQLIDAVNTPGAWSRLPFERKRMVLDNVRTALANDVRKPISREALAAALTIPVLLLTGENSPPSYNAVYDQLRTMIGCGPTVVIPNAAHMMHIENPVAFAAAITDFLCQASRPAARPGSG